MTEQAGNAETPGWPENRVAVITGGASGIGAAMARAFGGAGARIVLLDLDAAGLETLTEDLRREGVDAWFIACDIADESRCRAAVASVEERCGGIDILCNNAGITHRGPFRDAETGAIRTVMETNFFGALYCTKAALDSLIGRRGTIIVTSSIAGLAPVLGRTAYCASKHALHGMFGTLREELRGTGVHVMIVCPGFTRTRLQTRALDGRGRVTPHTRTMVGREASPESVASAILRGAARRKSLLVLSPAGRVSYALFRLSPSLYGWWMFRRLREEIRR